MNERMSELMQGRGELLARIAAQREQMAEIEAEWQTPLALADQGVVAVRFLRSHPWLVAAVAAFFVIRRRSVAGLVWGVWRAWKGYRDFTSSSGKLSSRG